jgi:hypothetical protein
MKDNLFKFIIVCFFLVLDFLFYIGFHEFDTCQNLKYVNSVVKEYGIEFHETSLSSDYIDSKCYHKGVAMCLFSFYVLSILSVFILFFKPKENKESLQ